MIRADIHTHSTFSPDADSDMADMTASAGQKGLETICFTEHMDYGCVYPDGDFAVDTEAYYSRYRELIGEPIPETTRSGSRASSADGTARCPEDPLPRNCGREYRASPADGIPRCPEVLFGVELGLQPRFQDFFRTYVKQYPFDFIIGSSHVADGMDPAFPGFFESFSSEKEAGRRYFECELECARLFPEEFDVYGHLDYALRYAPSGTADFAYEEYADVLDELLLTLIRNGRGIELNTGGCRRPFGRSNPHISILKRYRELGGEVITVGSDAHNAADIADHFRDAELLLRECGFSYYTVFRKRKPFFLEF